MTGDDLYTKGRVHPREQNLRQKREFSKAVTMGCHIKRFRIMRSTGIEKVERPILTGDSEHGFKLTNVILLPALFLC